MKTRRTFLKRLSAGSLLALMGIAPAKASEKNRVISNVLIHHVYFWLRNPEDESERAQFEQAIGKLTTIGQIQKSHFGVPAPTEAREVVDHSYTYSLMLMFGSKKDQDAYQVHPVHREFVEENQHLWEKVKVYDTIDV